MSKFTELRNGTANIDFVGPRRRWFMISAVIIAISLLSLGLRQGPGSLGLNLSIDFIGGSSIQVENTAGLSVAELRAKLDPLGLTAVRIEELGDGHTFRIRTETLGEDMRSNVVSAISEAVGTPSDAIDYRSVGPTFGAQIASRALLALGVFIGVVSLFIAWRFEWRMALGAIAALFHDLIITAGLYSLTGLEVTPSTVVAILTILGYSLYDTVVVYDKIKEIETEETRMEYGDVVNRAMNLVLMRSIFTSLTSLIPVGSVLIVGSLLLGAGTLTDFALALFVGIAAGTYSSIFIASPFVAALRMRVPKEPEDKGSTKPPKAKDIPEADTPTPRSVAGGSFDSRRPISSSGAPRPPKKKRR